MPLWILRPHPGGRVAIRMDSRRERAWRLVLDDACQRVVREEWRCAGCGLWCDRGMITWVTSGRAVSGAIPSCPVCEGTRLA